MKTKVLFSAICVVCATVGWESFLAFEGSEFGSGELAGNQAGAWPLFILAALLVAKFRRSAALLALLASYWSLPLYLYLVFPAPFRRHWPGIWKSPVLPTESFVWDPWWVTGILSALPAAALSVYLLCRRNLRQPPDRNPIATTTPV